MLALLAVTFPTTGSAQQSPADGSATGDAHGGVGESSVESSHLRRLINRDRIAFGKSSSETSVRLIQDDDDAGDEDNYEDIETDEGEAADEDHTITSPLRRISEIRPSLDYAWGDIDDTDLPTDFDEQVNESYFQRPVAANTIYQWKPTDQWYNPLYFEDVSLERYGHSYHPVIQPLVSTGRFVAQAVTLPYHATLRPVHSREYPLGYYRPGECAPKLKYKVPFNKEAAVNQAAGTAGLILLIP